jgi:hypothetical protein
METADAKTGSELMVKLDVSTRELLNVRARQIRYWATETRKFIAQIGAILAEVRTKVQHGHWLAWLDHEFAWSETQARRFIHVHEWLAGQPGTVADLSIDLKALYLLAQPSTPVAAREEAIKEASEGRRVTHAVAKNLIEINRAPKKKFGKPRRSPEQVAADKAAEQRRLDGTFIRGDVQSILRRNTPIPELAATILADTQPAMLQEFLDNLPIAVARLAELKLELQKRGAIKPATFGVARAVAIGSGRSR